MLSPSQLRLLALTGLHRDLYAVAPADVTATPLAGTYVELLRDVAADITAAWNSAADGGLHPAA